MPEIDEVTPDVDVVTEPVADSATTDTATNQPDEPFLRVNDRQQYKTREEAVRAYDEAGKRIAQLSGWEKTAKEYGLQDPKVMKGIFDETLSLREKVKLLEAAQAKPTAQATQTDAAETLSAEEKKARDYLKSVLPKLGYIAKDDLKETASQVAELKAQIEELKGASTQSREEHFSRQAEEAQDTLNTWVTSDFGDLGNKGNILGTLIKTWINSDQELIDRWSAGGVSARTLIREGYDLFKKDLPWTKPAAASTTAAVTAAKGRAVVNNKKLPQPGAGKDDTKGVKPKGGINRTLHEKAWDVFQSVRNQSA